MSRRATGAATAGLETSGRVEAIRYAAARLFQERGYEAATMRELARIVGLEAPSLYNHFPSKQDLLAGILIATMEEAIAAIRAAVAEAGGRPPDRLRAAITAYVLYHEDRLPEASISDTERRSLEPRHARRLYELRDEMSALVASIIEDGVATGDFSVSDVGVATIAVLSICARLPVWYSPDGRLGLDEVARLFASFALGALSAPDD